MARQGIVKLDLIGQRCGCYEVLAVYEQRRGGDGCMDTYWLCRCDCGHERFISRTALKNTSAQYCPACRPAGVRNEKLYHIYYGIKARCYNANNPSYTKYGAKGIRMCDEWL